MSLSDQTKSIVQQHLEGYSRSDIAEALAAEGVKQPEKVIDKALSAVAGMTGTGDQDVTWYKGALRELYRRNMEISDLKSSHHVLKDMMTLDGVYSDAKRTSHMRSLSNLKELPATQPKAKAKAKAKPKAQAKTAPVSKVKPKNKGAARPQKGK